MKHIPAALRLSFEEPDIPPAAPPPAPPASKRSPRLAKRVAADPDFLSPAAVADLLDVAKRTVWRMVSRGELPEPARLTRKLVRFDRAAVEAAMQAQAKAQERVEVAPEFKAVVRANRPVRETVRPLADLARAARELANALERLAGV